MPTAVRNAGLVPGAVEALSKMTDVPFRFVWIVDGGTQADIEEAQTHVMELPTWQIKQDHYGGYNATLNAAIDEMRSEFVAVIPPEIRMNDDHWFGKMQVIYTKDPKAMIVDAFEDTVSRSAPPGKRSVHNLGKDVKVFLSRRRVLAGLPRVPNDQDDPVHWLERTALKHGGSVWNSPSVLFSIMEHVCHASSTAATPSKSPSSTIQG